MNTDSVDKMDIMDLRMMKMSGHTGLFQPVHFGQHFPLPRYPTHKPQQFNYQLSTFHYQLSIIYPSFVFFQRAKFGTLGVMVRYACSR